MNVINRINYYFNAERYKHRAFAFFSALSPSETWWEWQRTSSIPFRSRVQTYTFTHSLTYVYFCAHIHHTRAFFTTETFFSNAWYVYDFVLMGFFTFSICVTVSVRGMAVDMFKHIDLIRDFCRPKKCGLMSCSTHKRDLEHLKKHSNNRLNDFPINHH